MPFKLLKQLILHLRKQTKCPACNSGFSENDIFVLTTGPSSLQGNSVGLFLMICPKCIAQAVVMIEASSITAKIRQIKREGIKIHTKQTSQNITIDDILDMHNFLKNWQGDVKELFKKV